MNYHLFKHMYIVPNMLMYYYTNILIYYVLTYYIRCSYYYTNILIHEYTNIIHNNNNIPIH